MVDSLSRADREDLQSVARGQLETGVVRMPLKAFVCIGRPRHNTVD